MTRYFMVKDKNGKIVSTGSETDAENKNGAIRIQVQTVADFTKKETSKDEYLKEISKHQ